MATSRAFVIPSHTFHVFTAKLEKLARKAAKLNCPIPTYTVVKEEIQTFISYVDDEWGQRKEVERPVLMTHITLDSSPVVVAGYEFLATIEHTEEGNILHSIAGTTIPTKYRDCKSECDHCKVHRRRNDTFILRNTEHNIHLQVGRNCLVDFLGHDAAHLAASAEFLFQVNELAEASESFSGGTIPQYDHLEDYLTYVAETISLCGWRSRTTAKEYGGESTSDIAYSHFHPTAHFLKHGEVLFRTPTDVSVQVAKDAIAWCENLSDEVVEPSDYLHNIRVIARRGLISAKQYGFAASIVSAYQRHMGDLKRKEYFANQALVSTYVGVVGERKTFTLTVDHVVNLPDYGFGESSLHLMYDNVGNRFTWKSSRTTLKTGETIVLKGTIKEHSEYKNIKQTVLSRCDKVEMRTYTTVIAGSTHTIPAESEKEALKILRSTLNMSKLPKGTKLTEKVG